MLSLLILLSGYLLMAPAGEQKPNEHWGLNRAAVLRYTVFSEKLSHVVQNYERVNCIQHPCDCLVNITYLVLLCNPVSSVVILLGAVITHFFQYFHGICSCHKIPQLGMQLMFISLRQGFQIALYIPKPRTIFFSVLRTYLWLPYR